MKNQQPPSTSASMPNLSPQQRMKLQKMQKMKEQMLQNRQRCMPFVRFLKKNKLRIKTATCQGRPVQYFRVDDFEQLVAEKAAEIDKDSVLKSVAQSWTKEIAYFQRSEHLPKLKYPKQLEFSQTKAKFASFKFDITEPRKWLFPVILFAIIAVVLFPLWPYMLKYGIFLCALYLVIAIVFIIILRLVVYLTCAVFGVSFWILPNFFENCSIYDSFFPFFSVSKWQTGIFSIIARLLALSIVGYYGYHLYMDPSWLFENIQITKTSINDLHDYGVGKIKGQKNFSQSALTDINDIINQTADAMIDEPNEHNGTQQK